MEKISLPVRIFAIVIVLAGLGGMLAMRTMAPSNEPVAIPLPVEDAREDRGEERAAARQGSSAGSRAGEAKAR